LISDQLFNKLRHFSQDRTFTQDPYIKRDGDNHYWSLDLTAATDRFPIQIQQDLLTEMLDKHVAFAWKCCMIREPFAYQNGKTITYYKYAIGQPMGAQSS